MLIQSLRTTKRTLHEANEYRSCKLTGEAVEEEGEGDGDLRSLS